MPARSRKNGKSAVADAGVSKRKPTARPHRTGPWKPHEDEQLIYLVTQVFGTSHWVELAREATLERSSKQCRERWHQNLDPSLLHTTITPEEGVYIEQYVREHGNRWAELARTMKGRSDNNVKNWYFGSENRRRRAAEARQAQMVANAAPRQQVFVAFPPGVHPNAPQYQVQYHVPVPQRPLQVPQGAILPTPGSNAPMPQLHGVRPSSTGQQQQQQPPVPQMATHSHQAPPPAPIQPRPQGLTLAPIQVPHPTAAVAPPAPSPANSVTPSLVHDRSSVESTPVHSPQQPYTPSSARPSSYHTALDGLRELTVHGPATGPVEPAITEARSRPSSSAEQRAYPQQMDYKLDHAQSALPAKLMPFQHAASGPISLPPLNEHGREMERQASARREEQRRFEEHERGIARARNLVGQVLRSAGCDSSSDSGAAAQGR